MGSGSRFSSRIFTNSFSFLEKEMSFSLRPNNYFGFQNQKQYSYNIYHQLANNGSGFGARGARWDRVNNVSISFIPPHY